MYELAVNFPIHNEEKSITKVLNDWIFELNKEKIDYCIILSEDGSSDETKSILSKFIAENLRIIDNIVEKKPGEEISKEELIDFCKGQISNFKIPRYIVFVNEWPMSSTKVQKFKLKNLDLGEKVFGN